MQMMAIISTSGEQLKRSVVLIEVTAVPRNGAGEGEKFVRADKSLSAKLKTSHFERKNDSSAIWEEKSGAENVEKKLFLFPGNGAVAVCLCFVFDNFLMKVYEGDSLAEADPK